MKAKLMLLLSCLALSAHAVEIGERLDTWTLPDQFDQPLQLDNKVRVILVAGSHGAAKLVDAAIKDEPKGYLEARQAIYIADITHMPRMVANRILVPSMRDANYRILLDREGEVASRYEANRGEVLWLTLEEGTLRERRQFSSADQLKEALEQQALAGNIQPDGESARPTP